MHLPEKIEAIKNIAVPTTKEELRSFIGLINYNRDMWKHRYSIFSTILKYDFQTSQMDLE